MLIACLGEKQYMAFRTNNSSMWKIVAIVPFLAVMLIAGGCGSVKSNAPDVGQSVTITLNLQSASVAVGTTKQFSAVVANTVQHGRHLAGKRRDRRRFDSRCDRYDRKIHRPRSDALSRDVTVTAVAQAEPSKTASATVTITRRPGLLRDDVSRPPSRCKPAMRKVSARRYKTTLRARASPGR